jgi:hypothetical protein
MNRNYKHIGLVEFECGPGWIPLIETALTIIDNHLHRKHMSNPNAGHITLDQVKEKFGGLRIYFTDHSHYSEYIDGVFDFAEAISHNICEECGKPGKTRGDLSWMKTLCADHYMKAKARQYEYTKLLESEK